MGDGERPAVRYRFADSIDLFEAFERAGIEHLEVSNQRTIVIYQRTIFNVDIAEETLDDVRIVEVDVFDVSPESDSNADSIPLADLIPLIDDLIDALATTVGVSWNRC